MTAPRFFLFILALGLIGYGLVWVFRYFFGGKTLETKAMMEKKVTEDELEALKNIKKSFREKKK